MPSKFEKTRPSRKAPEPIAKWWAVPRSTSQSFAHNSFGYKWAQIRAWKLCRKPFQGLLLGTRGTENFTQCLTMKHWSGANFWHQVSSPSVKVTRASFRPVRLLWPNGGLMGRSSNAHNFLISRRDAFEIFTICRRPPVLQTDCPCGHDENSSSRDGSA